MSDASMLAFGLTYTGTLVVALLMFLGQVTAFAALLVLAGTLRLVVVSVRALLPRSD